MAYVRINMVEIDSPEAMYETTKAINENAGTIFPDLQLFASIATAETSSLAISIYPYKEAADKAIAARDKHHEGKGAQVVMAYEGELNAFSQRPAITVSN